MKSSKLEGFFNLLGVEGQSVVLQSFIFHLCTTSSTDLPLIRCR